MEPLARIRDWPSATAASPAITPLAERVSASSPESVNADWRVTPSSCGGGERQRQQAAVMEDRLLEEGPSAWGEQASSSCSPLQGQWRRPALLGDGKGRRHGNGWRAARSAIFTLRARAAALHGPGAGKLRAPIALPEPQPLPAPAPQAMTAATAQWIYRFRGDEGDFVLILAAMDEGGYRLITSNHQVRDRLAAHLTGAPAGVRLMNVPAAASAPGLPEMPT